MQAKTIKAEPRTATGTKAAQRIRQTGRLPGIIYGHGIEPTPISLPAHEVEVELQHGGHLLRLELNGQTEQYLIKEVQYDHLGIKPIHIDLARVSLDERVTVEVPVELKGTPKGVQEGGVLDQVLMDLEVECVVTQIPEAIRVNVAHLGVGDVLHVRDITLPEGVSAAAEPDEVVCTVKLLAEEAAEEAEEAEAPAEPERIGRAAQEQPESEQAEDKSKGK